MPKGFITVILLGLVNAFAFAITPMLMLVSSLLGAQLSPNPSLATMPIAVAIIGSAVGVWPATQLMQRFGRKRALWLFLLLSASACLLASYSLAIQSFNVFCVCTFMVGVSNAALQQTRFAAMELVAPQHAASATSIILLSGVVAAVIGPEIAVLAKDFTAVEYQGSFLAIIGTIALGAVLLNFYQPPVAQLNASEKTATTASFQLFGNQGFILAAMAGAIAYMVMSFVMTATPISMHHHYGHSLSDTKWVIQSHIAAMFLPSLLTPIWVRLIGLKGMMIAGIACYGITIIIGLSDVSVNGFWLQLVILGIGWNMLFVAGTAMLPSTYPQGAQYKAQSLNDSLVFSSQAIAALSAGFVISVLSWQSMLLLCLLPMGLMLAMLGYSVIRREKLSV